jgi:beta-glucosidase
MPFPKGFVWGAATASYQVEGNTQADGRGPSVWDEFCSQPGRVQGGQSGAVACDHYRRYREDIALMGEIGLRGYRFSVAWPRILPEGRGTVNEAGLGFYDRLVDALLEAGIEPWLTLFHWDYPLALYREGGWLNPESPRWFADYTGVVVDRLSDRVTRWITLNEPQCFVGLGLLKGTQAPGDKLPMGEALRAAHHALVAHGLAVQVIRSRAKRPPSIGMAPTGEVGIPQTESAEDVAAARENHWAVVDGSLFNMAWWLDPIFKGHYPEQGCLAYGGAVPSPSDADLRTIGQPLDFLGLNIYHGNIVRRGPTGGAEVVPRATGDPITHYGWPVTPAALRWGPRFTHERYGLPLVITENGMANLDWVSLDGRVHDPQRIDYLARYLLELRRAVEDGARMLGYFAWSLMDNFEWSDGYRYRFGLVHVDYATQRRTLKDSALWYRDVIRSHGETLDATNRPVGALDRPAGRPPSPP